MRNQLLAFFLTPRHFLLLVIPKVLLLIAAVFCLVPVHGQTWSTVYSNSYINRDENGLVEVNGKFYLIGGAGAGNMQVEEYDPTTQNWTKKGTTPLDFHHMQPVVHNGLIYLICVWRGPYASEVDVSHVWTYNPATDTWAQGMTIPSNRRRGSAGVVLYNDKFYIFGGNSGGHGLQGDAKAWVDVFDPNGNGGQGSWTTLTDMPRTRDHFHAVEAGGKVYIIGGRDSGQNHIFFHVRQEIDVYDIGAGTWSTLPATANLPSQRSGMSAGVYGDEIVLMVGVGVWGAELKTTEAFNYVTQTWRTLPDAQHERSGTQAVPFGNSIFLASGIKGGGSRSELEKLTFSGNPTGTPPVITSHPNDQTVNEGSMATFTTSASGTPTLTYSWEVNSGFGWSIIAGANAATYQTPVTQAGDNGNQYRCLVSNAYGDVYTHPANLTVNTVPVGFPPVITGHPVSISVPLGDQGTFSVTVSGTQPMSYQWEINTGSGWSQIPGAINNYYTTPQATSRDDGTQYRVQVSNAYGSLMSNAANMNVGCEGAFLESAGMVVFEAENYIERIERSGKDWSNFPHWGAIGEVVEPGPNTGLDIQAGYSQLSPELKYEIFFSQTGNYYVWLRMFSRGNGDDSAHGGINGNESPTADLIEGNAGLWTWHWTRTTADGSDAYVHVSSPGVHTFNLWMQEDGVLIDRILLSTDPGFVPSDPGPPESPNCTPSTPFPVALTEFDAINLGNINQLDWVTETESNNDHFIVQRSQDMQIWERLGKVEGAGNSTVPTSYRYIDENPLEGETFYRLKQVDLNGTFQFSDVVSVQFSQYDPKILIAPNPSNGEFEVRFSYLEGGTYINVLSPTGQSIYHSDRSEDAGNGFRSHSLSLLNQPPGIYFLVVESGDFYFAEKIIVR